MHIDYGFVLQSSFTFPRLFNASSQLLEPVLNRIFKFDEVFSLRQIDVQASI